MNGLPTPPRPEFGGARPPQPSSIVRPGEQERPIEPVVPVISTHRGGQPELAPPDDVAYTAPHERPANMPRAVRMAAGANDSSKGPEQPAQEQETAPASEPTAHAIGSAATGESRPDAVFGAAAFEEASQPPDTSTTQAESSAVPPENNPEAEPSVAGFDETAGSDEAPVVLTGEVLDAEPPIALPKRQRTIRVGPVMASHTDNQAEVAAAELAAIRQALENAPDITIFIEPTLVDQATPDTDLTTGMGASAGETIEGGVVPPGRELEQPPASPSVPLADPEALGHALHQAVNEVGRYTIGIDRAYETIADIASRIDYDTQGAEYVAAVRQTLRDFPADKYEIPADVVTRPGQADEATASRFVRDPETGHELPVENVVGTEGPVSIVRHPRTGDVYEVTDADTLRPGITFHARQSPQARGETALPNFVRALDEIDARRYGQRPDAQ